MITKYKLYVEEKMGNLAVLKGDDTYIQNWLNKEFEIDEELITDIYLDDFNKNILFTWYDTDTHNIKTKLNKRTRLYSISEFNEKLEYIINELFIKHFEELAQKYFTYELVMSESNVHVLISLNYSKLFSDETTINVLTVLPNQFKNPDKVIYFDC